MSPVSKAWIQAGPYLGIGWFFVVSIGLFTTIGWWLDARLGTGQALLLAGSLLGIVLGFVNLFKVVQLIQRKKR